MISQIEGNIRRLLENRVELDVGGLTYEIMLPSRAYEQLRGHDPKEKIRLYTFHYLEGGMTSLPVPRLVGFINELDREFFQLLRTVKNVGVKTALASMILPISQYARAIENEDIPTLKSLPEIGPATAKRIIAEIKGKLTKFILFTEDAGSTVTLHPVNDFRTDAIEVLLQLGKKRNEAELWVDKVSRSNPDVHECDVLLTLVFKELSQSGN
jgi:Holliday junction DNA helicase RuvA